MSVHDKRYSVSIQNYGKSGRFSAGRILGLGLFLLALLGTGQVGQNSQDALGPHHTAAAQTPTNLYLPLLLQPSRNIPKVNAPYFDDNIVTVRSAIFWLGEVTPTANYADVRVGYNDTELQFIVNIIDRRLWYDSTPTPDELSDWDAVSLLLDLSGNNGQQPGSTAYKIISQLSTETSPSGNWFTSFNGIGGSWTPTPLNVTASTGWRGNAVNDNIDDHGWSTTFTIPFTSLGLSGPPPENTIWGLGLLLHDRDDQQGSPEPDTKWPSDLDPMRSSTWGRLNFGWPAYVAPDADYGGTIQVQHGVQGVQISDAAVGGYSTCGGTVNYWQDWGELNYAGDEQINVQNQMDIADWPCFSKVYLTIPLDSIPAHKVILSGTLTLNHFGNAGGGIWGEPPNSQIQVLTTGEDWVEATITWNNAPLAVENIDIQTVPPLDQFPGWPGVPRTWDVSRAVAQAYAAGEPLRLVVYSADGPRHTGKYFYSSDADLEGRPKLEIIWGQP